MFQLSNRLHLHTQKISYKNHSSTLWNFLTVNGLVNLTTGFTHNGIVANCTPDKDDKLLSYNAGNVIGALAFYDEVQGTKSKYFTLGGKILNRTLSELENENGVWIDGCDPSCNDDGKIFKGILARNIRYFIDQSSNENLRNYYSHKLEVNAEALWHLASCNLTFRNCSIEFRDGPALYRPPIGPVFDPVWQGPFNKSSPIPQTSALELFVACIPTNVTCVGPSCSYNPPTPYYPPLTCDDHPCPAPQQCCGGDGQYAYTCCAEGQTCLDGYYCGNDPCRASSCNIAKNQTCCPSDDGSTFSCCKQTDVCVSGACYKNQCNPGPCSEDETCCADYFGGAATCCTSQEICSAGACVSNPCTPSPCTGNTTCCSIAGESATCCTKSQRCEQGFCKGDPCHDSPCDDSGVCCHDPYSGGFTCCTSSQTCQDGYCVGDPCKDNPCSQNETCCSADGSTYQCCKSNESCNQGYCYHDPCSDKPCKNDTTCCSDSYDSNYQCCEKSESCDQGYCYTDQCKKNPCKEGEQCCSDSYDSNYQCCKKDQSCQGGYCYEDACSTNPCPDDQTCCSDPYETGYECCTKNQACDQGYCYNTADKIRRHELFWFT